MRGLIPLTLGGSVALLTAFRFFRLSKPECRGRYPIVDSSGSIVIMKGMQNAGVSSLETDTAYFSPRQPMDDLGFYPSSIASVGYQGRDFCCTEQPYNMFDKRRIHEYPKS
jgi:hypothetical protein